jgi:hypothetical protein
LKLAIARDFVNELVAQLEKREGWVLDQSGFQNFDPGDSKRRAMIDSSTSFTGNAVGRINGA